MAYVVFVIIVVMDFRPLSSVTLRSLSRWNNVVGMMVLSSGNNRRWRRLNRVLDRWLNRVLNRWLDRWLNGSGRICVIHGWALEVGSFAPLFG